MSCICAVIGHLIGCRRSAVVEGIISEFQKERNGSHNYDSDSEGAKIYQMLETTEEPEFLMADMSPEQLMAFSAYKSKVEVGLEFTLKFISGKQNEYLTMSSFSTGKEAVRNGEIS